MLNLEGKKHYLVRPRKLESNPKVNAGDIHFENDVDVAG